MNNIYYLHDKINIGRFELIRPIHDVIGGNFIDKNIFEIDDGILVNTIKRSLKEILIDSMNDHITNNASKYMILFDDNFKISYDFSKDWKFLLKFLKRTDKDIIFINQRTNSKSFELRRMIDIKDVNLNGIIINRKIMPKLVEYLDNNSLDKAIKKFRCFYSSRQMIENYDRFNKDFIERKQILLFVLSNRNLTQIKKFIVRIEQFIPIIKPVFIMIENITKKELTFFDENNINYHQKGNLSEIINSYDYTIYKDYYGLTNMYINWKVPLINFFPMINSSIKKYNKIIIKCSNDQRIFNNFSFINKNQDDKKDDKLLNLSFYNIRESKIISKTEDDFIDDFKSLENNNILLNNSPIEEDYEEWKDELDKWKEDNNYKKTDLINFFSYDVYKRYDRIIN